jgi:hypothetical protein
MSIAITTTKGKNKASLRWNETFVFFGRICVNSAKDTLDIPATKLVFFRTMLTRVNGSGKRIWCEMDAKETSRVFPTANA